MTSGAVVGLVANPASARDIRRLVADGAAITTNQKLNVLVRLLSGLAAGGVTQVLSMTDKSGLSGGLASLRSRSVSERLPAIDFVDHPITRTASDTTAAVDAMVQRGVSALVVLGGDGTNRIVAQRSGSIPLASISTGTNNAFPDTTEPTVVGLATALVATARLAPTEVTYRAKMLELRLGDRIENALVDVAVVDSDRVGSGAIWDPRSIRHVFLTFAEAHAIGLSSIGAHVRPVCRTAPIGLHLRLEGSPDLGVTAPLAPGRLSEVGIAAVENLEPGHTVVIDERPGTLAVDGERLFRFDRHTAPAITLTLDGPVVIEIARAMSVAAHRGLLATTRSAPQPTKGKKT